MTFKRMAAAAAALVLSLAGLVFTASPASADGGVPIRSAVAGHDWTTLADDCGPQCERSKTAATPCQYNYSVCGYESFNHLCDDGCEAIPRTTPGCESVALSNQWSSFYNNSGRTVRLYDTNNCTSSYITFYNGTGTAYFLVTNPDWENKVSSVRFL